MLRFDREALAARLQRLPLRTAIAFAAAVAERLITAVRVHPAARSLQVPPMVHRALSLAWEDAMGNPVSESELANALDGSLDAVPDEDSYADGTAYLDDAISAVAFALRTKVLADPTEASWAASRAYEATDYFVENELGLDYTKHSREMIDRQVPIQRELLRQAEDLAYLEDLARQGELTAAVSIERLRERARNQGQSVFSRDG